MRTRSLGLGNTILTTGTDMYGYYGKYKGIITPNELIALSGITEGITKNDAYNDPTSDITWLKFSHNYKTLFVADRTIQYAISWNHLESLGLVFGKVIDIDGQKYLLRLMQGANINPAGTSGGANSNDEWDSLIGQFAPDTADSHWDVNDNVNSNGGAYCWFQETHNASIIMAIFRGATTLSNIGASTKGDKASYRGFRPVLEVL